jgi:general stress protein YciG
MPAGESGEKDPKRVAAGRKGGQTTRKRHGTEHFRKAGRAGGTKGGSTTLERYGREFYRLIGAKGGADQPPPAPGHLRVARRRVWRRGRLMLHLRRAGRAVLRWLLLSPEERRCGTPWPYDQKGRPRG